MLPKGKKLPNRSHVWFLVFLIVLPAFGEGNESSSGEGRRLTVADTIQMTAWANRSYAWNSAPDGPVAIFSPDRSQFIVALKRGNIDRDTVESSLLLFESKSVFLHPQPRILITMSSTSNRDAIQGAKWLDDKSVVFLGESPGATPQIYRLEVESGHIQKLTDHPTPIVAFDMSKEGGEIVYEAMPQVDAISDAHDAIKSAIPITTQRLADLFRCGTEQDREAADRELFVMKPGLPASRIPSADYLTEYLPLSISRKGRYALLAVYLRNIPDMWREYKDNLLHLYVTERRKPGTMSSVLQLIVLDTVSQKLIPLVDAPLSWHRIGFAFAPDENSVAVSGTYLPLNVPEVDERINRESRTSIVEVSLPDRQVKKISEAELRVRNWDEVTGKLFLESESAGLPVAEAYQRLNSKWSRTDLVEPNLSGDALLEVTLEEDMNSAPKIFVSDKRAKKSLLLDLNPQLEKVKLAHVEAVRLKATDGHELEGGLYLPPDYTPGQRYPVVIQTHGFRSDRFQLNGPHNSAFAAQPLAARGIVVLQIGQPEKGDDEKYANTLEEAPRQMAVFEGAIDYLDRRGIVDLHRVGLLGFSRTAFYVAFTLTHSKYQFAAATMADGFEGGYMNYLLWPNSDYLSVNGGAPAGPNLESWLRNSPGFNLDKVSAPVHLESYGPIGVLGAWQWFSGLGLLGKPVDFLWLPRGSHILAKPSERLASQGGTVDWFTFWLLGVEDSSAAKKDQYERWRKLREKRDAQKENTREKAE